MNNQSWYRLRDHMIREQTGEFYPLLILEIGKRILMINDDSNDYYSEFEESEKIVFKSLWEMDFIDRQNLSFYYRLFTEFAAETDEYSPKLLGILSDVVLALTAERHLLKAFLILSLINIYIRKTDIRTADQLLESIPEQDRRVWQTGVAAAKLEILSSRNVSDGIPEIMEWMTDVYDARKEEFTGIGITFDSLQMKLADFFLKHNFMKKAVLLMKKMTDNTVDEEVRKKGIDWFLTLAESLAEEKDYVNALEIMEWLCTVPAQTEKASGIVYRTGVMFQEQARLEPENDLAESFMEKSRFYLESLEERFPQAPELKKIGFRILKRRNLETVRQKNRLKEHIWIFFLSSWFLLIVSVFLSVPLSMMPAAFVAIYLVLLLIFKHFLEKFFSGDLG